MDYLYEYYVKDADGLLVLLGKVKVSRPARSVGERNQLGRKAGLDGWNYVVCGVSRLYVDEGPGYVAEHVGAFVKDDRRKWLAINLIETVDGRISAVKVVPMVKGYVYSKEFVKELSAMSLGERVSESDGMVEGNKEWNARGAGTHYVIGTDPVTGERKVFDKDGNVVKKGDSDGMVEDDLFSREEVKKVTGMNDEFIEEKTAELMKLKRNELVVMAGGRGNDAMTKSVLVGIIIKEGLYK